ncbi:MAG: hypothetical protein JXC36_01165 [Candidatus Atribacteria bacterium]|nr:hypothetical protein [Candidatus Atribacteria bacterium]
MKRLFCLLFLFSLVLNLRATSDENTIVPVKTTIPTGPVRKTPPLPEYATLCRGILELPTSFSLYENLSLQCTDDSGNIFSFSAFANSFDISALHPGNYCFLIKSDSSETTWIGELLCD